MRLHGDLGTFFFQDVSVHVQRVEFGLGDPWIIFVFRHGLEVLGKKFRCGGELTPRNALSWLISRLRELGDEGEVSCRGSGDCEECRSQCRTIGLTLASWLEGDYPRFLELAARRDNCATGAGV